MELNEAREKINEIDEQLVKLFSSRMELSSKIAEYKAEKNLPILDRTREREVLNKVADLSGPELENYSKVLFSTLFDLSRSYQNRLTKSESPLGAQIQEALENTPKQFPTKVVAACQGVEGAYSQQACDKIFSLPNIMYFRTFEGVFQAVEKGLCQYGILPIENSTAGSVNAVYDLMSRYHFYIARSIRLRIEHSLLARTAVPLSKIKEVVSHEQAISQCSAFLKNHPEIKVTVVENTAAAAKMVAESDRDDLAAISSRSCAELYGLSTLSDTVQNSENNFTRFICISKKLEIYPGAGKTSLMLTVPHRPGSLYGVIARIAALGMNLTKLESRPIPGKDFEFMFYFDLDASIYDPEVVRLICELDSDLDEFAYLGSYSELF
ncbi:MAG TPA: chorismate mutase [Candidatus Fimivivens faecavium]|mgnify:FL=1|nr:chorismate mutase [Candidatus Fimivivens faecavium]